MTADEPGIIEPQQLVCPECGAREFSGGVEVESGRAPRCLGCGHEWPPAGDDGLSAEGGTSDPEIRRLRLFAALLDRRTADYDCPDCGGTLAQPDPGLDAFECVRCGEVVREVGDPDAGEGSAR